MKKLGFLVTGLFVGLFSFGSFILGVSLHELGHKKVLERIGCDAEIETVEVENSSSIGVSTDCPDHVVREARIATYSYDSSSYGIVVLYPLIGALLGIQVSQPLKNTLSNNTEGCGCCA